jgi:hypothetical protein
MDVAFNEFSPKYKNYLKFCSHGSRDCTGLSLTTERASLAQGNAACHLVMRLIVW